MVARGRHQNIIQDIYRVVGGPFFPSSEACPMLLSGGEEGLVVQ